VPCLIARPDLHATLVESSQKKAVFLREVLRHLSLNAQVLSSRFEDVSPATADYLTCRALERLSQKLPVLIEWAPRPSTLLLFAGDAIRAQIETLGLEVSAFLIPTSQQRFLLVIKQKD
jgi:16S rRNA G527 N7-methylase RsmG